MLAAHLKRPSRLILVLKTRAGLGTADLIRACSRGGGNKDRILVIDRVEATTLKAL